MVTDDFPLFSFSTSGNKPKKRISQTLLYCLKCKSVWETIYQTKKCVHYEDFPTIGLVRKLCIHCKK